MSSDSTSLAGGATRSAQRYRSYLLTVLLVILAFNYVDRAALGLLLQDIKTDLQLSDTQLGFLTGIAFALFYSLMGIPIARWADRGNRVTIITLTTAVWAAAVALCAAAATFLQLLAIRIAVAVGEAGCMPPAQSLIADYFSRAERPRATARYMLGGPLSVIIGFFLAGWLNEFYGWRMTFVILGLPGLVLAVLVWLTLHEPRSAASSAQENGSASATPSWREVFSTLWANTVFRHVLFSFSVSSFFSYGIAQWQPAFFIRSFGLQTGELGTWFAAICGLGGMAGTYLGGEWALHYAMHNERLQLKTLAVVHCGAALISVLLYLSTNRYLAFSLLGLIVIGGAAGAGPMFAMIQTLVPQRMRAISVAMLLLFANLIGMGLGPLVTGVLSDSLHHWSGEESLRYSLLALSPGYLWSAWHLRRAGTSVTRQLQAAAY